MLPRPRRLRRGDFARIYRLGRRVRLPSVTVWWAQAAVGETNHRFGVVVSSRIAKRAVERNLYRRRLFACLAGIHSTTPPQRVIISANPSINTRSYSDLKAELNQFFSHFPPTRGR